jgi:quercetin dioxygenase-like cupin family protein
VYRDICKLEAAVTAITNLPVELFISPPNDDNRVWFLGVETWIRSTAEQTGGTLGLVENLIPAGDASPYHVHHNEDEACYVVKGTLRFFSGDDSWVAGEGSYVFMPRGIPHGFQVEGDEPARILLFVTPAGFEHFVADISEPAPPAGPPDIAHVVQVAAGYNIEILGPLPGQSS